MKLPKELLDASPEEAMGKIYALAQAVVRKFEKDHNYTSVAYDPNHNGLYWQMHPDLLYFIRDMVREGGRMFYTQAYGKNVKERLLGIEIGPLNEFLKPNELQLVLSSSLCL